MSQLTLTKRFYVNLGYKLTYSSQALKQLKKLDKPMSKKLVTWLNDRIPHASNPRLWGDQLKGNLGGFWRYRVGDFRVICEIRDHELVVLVLQVGHRKEIYSE